MKRIVVLASLIWMSVSLASAQAATRTVIFAWAPSPTPGVSYNVFRAATSNGPFAQLNAGPVSGLVFLDATAVVKQTYTYYVVAYLACPTPIPAGAVCGSAAPSPMSSITVPDAPGASTATTLTVP